MNAGEQQIRILKTDATSAKIEQFRLNIFVFLLFLLLSIALTWPLIFHLNTTLFGDFGDARGVTWAWWLKSNPEINSSQILVVPFGIDENHFSNQPIVEWISVGVAKLFGEASAYNIVVLLSFPLTASATFFFLYHLLRNKTAAFVGALIFGFCPASVMQAAGGHVTFAFNMFIPLFLFALFQNKLRRTIFSAVIVGVSYALIALTGIYVGYFAIYIAVFFLVFDLLSEKKVTAILILRNYLLSMTVASALLLPFEFYDLQHQITTSSEELSLEGRVRNFAELEIYSSRPWDYLLPSPDHPILGKYVVGFVGAHLHNSNIFEQTLYLGIIPLALLLLGVFITYTKILVDKNRKYFLFFSFAALWMYVLSLPPQIEIANIAFPTISSVAYKVAPVFRVYARLGILVNFFVACSVAVVLVHLSQQIRRPRFIALMAVLISLLAFEYWSIPPNFAHSISSPPAVYNWLAKQQGDFAIAEYPMMNNSELAFSSYPFWQRVHKKKLVNGASPDNQEAWHFFNKIRNLNNPQLPTLLKYAGVKYVVVHGKMYQEGPIPEAIKRYYPAQQAGATYNDGRIPSVPFGLKLVKKWGDDFLFSLE